MGEREERLGLHLLSVLEENIFSFFVRLSLLLAGERERDTVEMVQSVGREVNQRSC